MDARLQARLPPELTDAIIDHLAHDRATLEACSLVCKAWAPRSQQLLHAKVHVTFRHLKTRVDAALPLSIARYVKAVFLYGRVEVGTQSVERWNALSRFPNIHRFSITRFCLGVTLASPLASTLPTVFANTTYLSTCFTTIHDYDIYHRFLLSFPALTHLDVGSIPEWIGEDSSVPPLTGTTPTQHPLYDNARAFASRLQSFRMALDADLDE